MRINNLSARLMVNERLAEVGLHPLSSDLSYEQFATELRRVTARKMAQPPFVTRADAVAYIRMVARARETMIPHGR